MNEHTSDSVKTKPLVTIGIVTYNRANLLARAIDSALKQSWPSFEVLVIDNASTDNTCKMLGEKYPEVKLLKTHKNLGCPPARNLVMANMLGDFFVSLDDDGILNQDAVAVAMSLFEESQKIGIVHMNVIEKEKSVYPSWPRGYRTGTFPGGANIIRKIVLEECGYFDDAFFRQGEEYDLSIRMHERGYEIAYCPDAIMNHYPVVFSRTSPELQAVGFLNKSISLLKFAPLKYIVLGLPRRILGYAWVLTKLGKPWLIIKSVVKLFVLAPSVLKKRKVHGRGYKMVKLLIKNQS